MDVPATQLNDGIRTAVGKAAQVGRRSASVSRPRCRADTRRADVGVHARGDGLILEPPIESLGFGFFAVAVVLRHAGRDDNRRTLRV
jgi:hypothetical protein